MSIENAINSGLYGDTDMNPYKDKLKQIYPNGVCDYRFSDTAKPQDMVLNQTIKAVSND